MRRLPVALVPEILASDRSRGIMAGGIPAGIPKMGEYSSHCAGTASQQWTTTCDAVTGPADFSLERREPGAPRQWLPPSAAAFPCPLRRTLSPPGPADHETWSQREGGTRPPSRS
jgi:hypothetical protein